MLQNSEKLIFQSIYFYDTVTIKTNTSYDPGMIYDLFKIIANQNPSKYVAQDSD